VGVNRHARTLILCDNRQQLFDPFTPLGGGNAELGQMRRNALINWVRWRISRSRTRCSINRPYCSADLVRTKRMVGRRTASQIASASVASFLLRLT
jgi:hypothetical protein